MGSAQHFPSTWGAYGQTTFGELAEAVGGYRPSDILVRVGQWSKKLDDYQREHGNRPMPVNLPRHVARDGCDQGINVAHSLLALIARLSLIRGYGLAPGHLTDDGFLRLLRTGCELWEPADDALNPEYLLRVMYEQAPYQDDVWQALPRAKLMYVDACDALTAPEMDIAVEFEERFGLPIDSFITIGFALFAQLFTDPVFYPLVHWHTGVRGMRDVLTKDNVNAFLNIVAVDQQRFRDEDAHLRPAGVNEGRYDFNPLFKYPVIDLGGGKCTAPLPNLVVWRLYTAPFYELADFMEEGPQNRFRAFFGHVFQSYIGLLLRDALPHKDVLAEVGGAALGRLIGWRGSGPMRF